MFAEQRPAVVFFDERLPHRDHAAELRRGTLVGHANGAHSNRILRGQDSTNNGLGLLHIYAKFGSVVNYPVVVTFPN